LLRTAQNPNTKRPAEIWCCDDDAIVIVYRMTSTNQLQPQQHKLDRIICVLSADFFWERKIMGLECKKEFQQNGYESANEVYHWNEAIEAHAFISSTQTLVLF
jgi:hypothetical protein